MSKYAFTGQYSEADIGLYYFGARWYDASLGRFISEDPIKGSMISSQSQNPYVYCMNNPLRFVDPTGMLMTEGGGFYDGYLQTYYGGEYHYYSAMDGSCNVSGDSYTEDHFAKQSTTSTPNNTITGKDVKQTVTKSNFFANYNFMGKGSPINIPGKLNTESVTWRLDLTFALSVGELSLVIMHDPTGNWFMGTNSAWGLSFPGFYVSGDNMPEFASIEQYKADTGYLNGGTTHASATFLVGGVYSEKNGKGSLSPVVFGTPGAGITVDTPTVELMNASKTGVLNNIYGRIVEGVRNA